MNILRLLVFIIFILVMSNILLWILQSKEQNLLPREETKLIGWKNKTKIYYIRTFPIMIVPESPHSYFLLPVISSLVLSGILICLTKLTSRLGYIRRIKGNSWFRLNNRTRFQETVQNKYSKFEENEKIEGQNRDGDPVGRIEQKEQINLTGGANENDIAAGRPTNEKQTTANEILESLQQKVSSNQKNIEVMASKMTRAENQLDNLEKQVQELRKLVKSVEEQNRSLSEETYGTEEFFLNGISRGPKNTSDSQLYLRRRETAILSELKNLGLMISDLRKKAESIDCLQTAGPRPGNNSDDERTYNSADELRTSASPAPFYLSGLKLRNSTVAGHKKNSSHHQYNNDVKK